MTADALLMFAVRASTAHAEAEQISLSPRSAAAAVAVFVLLAAVLDDAFRVGRLGVCGHQLRPATGADSCSCAGSCSGSRSGAVSAAVPAPDCGGGLARCLRAGVPGLSGGVGGPPAAHQRLLSRRHRKPAPARVAEPRRRTVPAPAPAAAPAAAPAPAAARTR